MSKQKWDGGDKTPGNTQMKTPPRRMPPSGLGNNENGSKRGKQGRG